MRSYQIIFITILSFLTSCGLLQHTTTTTTKDDQEFLSKADLSTAASRQWNLESQSLTFYTDSTQQNYAVQLWPKGQFTYSPLNGFVGEAEKVIVSGHVQGVKTGGGSTVSKADESSHMELKLKTVEEAKAQQTAVVKKTVPSAWWVFGCLMLLAAISIYFLRLKF